MDLISSKAALIFYLKYVTFAPLLKKKHIMTQEVLEK